MSPHTSPLAPQIGLFLQHKHGLGYAYAEEERLLWILDRVAVEAHLAQPVIDEPLVRRFVSTAPRQSRSYYLSVVRQFARFLAAKEPRTFVPPRQFLGIRRSRPAVRVLSRDEASRFLCACDQMTDHWRFPHRRLCHGTALRVLLLTGLRSGEALALRVSDVDLVTAVVHVRRAKFGKSRFVPLADDLADRLRRYDAEFRSVVAERGADDAFFPGPDGHSTSHPVTFYNSFRRVLELAGITHRGRGEGPTKHSLRHTFAVLKLLSWYEQGADLQVKLPLLATYLGHVGLQSSQVYLHMTYDLVGEITRRVEARFGNIITAEVAP